MIKLIIVFITTSILLIGQDLIKAQEQFKSLGVSEDQVKDLIKSNISNSKEESNQNEVEINNEILETDNELTEDDLNEK